MLQPRIYYMIFSIFACVLACVIVLVSVYLVLYTSFVSNGMNRKNNAIFSLEEKKKR